jgi:hypothetical protein
VVAVAVELDPAAALLVRRATVVGHARADQSVGW